MFFLGMCINKGLFKEQEIDYLRADMYPGSKA